MLEYFLDPHPDELLYSVWARYSDQAQYPNQADVVQELFGKRSYSALVDWSCSLEYLVNQLSIDHSYTTDTLINGHTLFPFYAPFLPQERRQLLREQMITGNGTAFYNRMGMTASRIPRCQWLRYCPLCVESDREQFGETYWHRLHRAPGVEVCPVHDTFLENSVPVSQTGLRSFISAERAIHLVDPRSSIDFPMHGVLKDIAEIVFDLLNHSYSSPGNTFFREQYLAILDQNGFTTIKNAMRVVEFLKAFTDHYSPECLSLLHCQLSNTRHIEAEWPARLLYGHKSQHPLHHILVTRLLGVTLETFLSTPLQPSQPFGNGPWPCLNPVCLHYRQLCIANYSIREKSKKGHPVGIFGCTCGFTYSRVGPDKSPEDIFRRDRIPWYGPLWQKKLYELWSDPYISKENIARHLGVDFNTMTRQVRELALPPRPLLREASIQKSKVIKDTAEYRKEWLEILEENPNEGITTLTHQVKQARAIYNWLYKHDQEWLLSHRPVKKIPQEVLKENKEQIRIAFRSSDNPTKKVERREYDLAIAESIRSTAYQIMHVPGEPRRVTRIQIEKATPIIPWLVRRPDDYPLTTQALREAIETRESFALRRICWTLQKYQEEHVRPTRREFILRSKTKKVLDISNIQVAIADALTTLDH